MIRRALPACLLVFAATAASLVHERDAIACGGCFHPPPPPEHPTEVESVVTDHRMVFSISTTQTVLWDQIRYSGNPSEFAWVLPVKPGARIELSHDEWMAALDQATRSQVTGPAPKQCAVTYPTYSGGRGGGGGGGCTFGSASSVTNSSFASSDDAGVSSADGSAAEDSGVVVIRQDVVGPYQTVTVRASAGEALQTWLTKNGFDVPAALEPTLAAYTTEGFDFIALKLRPGVGVRAMQPVRVVTDGADTSLPLRMIAAGIGAHVGLELYVITEGRYHPQNFPDVNIDFAQLAWDPYQQRSNFAQLEAAALASGDGRGWITEFAGRLGYGVGGLYQSTCMPTELPPVACDASAPSDASHILSDAASSSDASDGEALDGDVGDALADAHHTDAATCTTPQPPSPCDDFSVATDGLHLSDIWITRLKADLPAGALAVGDLRLEPAAYQQTMTNLHSTETLTDPTYDPCPKAQASPDASGASDSGCACTTSREDGGMGSYFLIALTAIAASTILRRRRV